MLQRDYDRITPSSPVDDGWILKRFAAGARLVSAG